MGMRASLRLMGVENPVKDPRARAGNPPVPMGMMITNHTDTARPRAERTPVKAERARARAVRVPASPARATASPARDRPSRARDHQVREGKAHTLAAAMAITGKSIILQSAFFVILLIALISHDVYHSVFTIIGLSEQDRCKVLLN